MARPPVFSGDESLHWEYIDTNASVDILVNQPVGELAVLLLHDDGYVLLAGPLTLTGPATHIADFEVPDA